jgi:hypothetical protein
MALPKKPMTENEKKAKLTALKPQAMRQYGATVKMLHVKRSAWPNLKPGSPGNSRPRRDGLNGVDGVLLELVGGDPLCGPRIRNRNVLASTDSRIRRQVRNLYAHARNLPSWLILTATVSNAHGVAADSHTTHHGPRTRGRSTLFRFSVHDPDAATPVTVVPASAALMPATALSAASSALTPVTIRHVTVPELSAKTPWISERIASVMSPEDTANGPRRT